MTNERNASQELQNAQQIILPTILSEYRIQQACSSPTSHLQIPINKINHMYDSLTVVLRKSVAFDNKTWWHTYNGNDWDEEIQTDRDYLLGTLHFLDIQLKPYMDETAVNAIQASPFA